MNGYQEYHCPNCNYKWATLNYPPICPNCKKCPICGQEFLDLIRKIERLEKTIKTLEGEKKNLLSHLDKKNESAPMDSDY